MEKEYLGDGVYASFDGWQIRLSTERDKGPEIIYLEPTVLASLINYARRALPESHRNFK